MINVIGTERRQEQVIGGALAFFASFSLSTQNKFNYMKAQRQCDAITPDTAVSALDYAPDQTARFDLQSLTCNNQLASTDININTECSSVYNKFYLYLDQKPMHNIQIHINKLATFLFYLYANCKLQYRIQEAILSNFGAHVNVLSYPMRTKYTI